MEKERRRPKISRRPESPTLFSSRRIKTGRAGYALRQYSFRAFSSSRAAILLGPRERTVASPRRRTLPGASTSSRRSIWRRANRGPPKEISSARTSTLLRRPAKRSNQVKGATFTVSAANSTARRARCRRRRPAREGAKAACAATREKAIPPKSQGRRIPMGFPPVETLTYSTPDRAKLSHPVSTHLKTLPNT